MMPVHDNVAVSAAVPQLLLPLPAVAGAWPDFAARSFYDAHLSYIVAASDEEIIARRKAEPIPIMFVEPKGRYQTLARNATRRRGRARGKGKGGRGVWSRAGNQSNSRVAKRARRKVNVSGLATAAARRLNLPHVLVDRNTSTAV